MKKSLGNYFKSHSLDSTTNNGSTTTTTTTTTTATTPTPTPSCNASLNSLHPDTLKLLYLTWLHGLFPEQSKATTLNHHHHPFSTSSSSSSSSTNTTTTASSSSSSSHFTSPSLPHHVLSALKNNELLCYEDVLHAEFNHAVYLSMHLPSYPNDKVSLISLLKQQHLSGQMNYEELYRCRLHLLKKQEKVYQTSGDVNAIHITE
ncbi:hypothetical protein HMI55_002676 [Coelomomyces lativittatus]|nr:hypothetical protein HMI55_002676 [Coelomomyces lativittatus]